MQGELFAAEPVMAGLALSAEVATEADEAELAARIDDTPLAPFQFGQWQGKRLTANYGSSYDYQRGRVADAPPIPDWLLGLRELLGPVAGLRADDFVQALLIRYDPGAGIGWHRDRPQYGTIIGLSLSSPAMLRLRRRTAGGFERRSVALPRRALYVLAGEVREEWEHSIAPLDATRRSITFRTLR